VARDRNPASNVLYVGQQPHLPSASYATLILATAAIKLAREQRQVAAPPAWVPLAHATVPNDS
jgi:hypothetical protein